MFQGKTKSVCLDGRVLSRGQRMIEPGAQQVTKTKQHEKRKRRVRQARTVRKERQMEVRVREQLRTGTLSVPTINPDDYMD